MYELKRYQSGLKSPITDVEYNELHHSLKGYYKKKEEPENNYNAASGISSALDLISTLDSSPSPSSDSSFGGFGDGDGGGAGATGSFD